MQLLNIHNDKRKIYLFTRDDKGVLSIAEDNTFFPYYYEPDPAGQFVTYDNKRVRKIVMPLPGDVAKKRSPQSYEADILFPKRYIIDNVDEFQQVPIKYFFLDIEVLAKELPDENKAQFPISCITIYNSFSKSLKTWWLRDFVKESDMLNDFVDYVAAEKPDLILAWNSSFDYTYLAVRIKDFAKKISPLGMARYASIPPKEGGAEVLYPAGISVVDYMGMFKKIYMREQSYALDNVAQKHLAEGPWKKSDFGVLSDDIKAKNINDVVRMMKLEEKMHILDYYDAIRRSAMCLWEDLLANSRILDMVVLKEAKKRGVVLPNRKKKEDGDGVELEGAYRRSDAGVYKGLYKADVASMYPNQLINFCLDTQNITTDTSEVSINVNGIRIKQNPDALLPVISRKLISQKDSIKQQLKIAKPDTEEYRNLYNNYNAIKGLVNSLYGLTAFPSFRVYNHDIASSITFLARDLLRYVEDSMNKLGFKVIYTDTDALMYTAEKDEIDLLNKLVQDWAISKYEKEVNIVFESEGMFEKILILSKCHYYGYIKTDKGLKKEIKGVEVKRSSSSKFESKFQDTLINKILDGEPAEQVMSWVKNEVSNIKNVPLSELAFPCKISNRVYKNETIFLRAYRYTKELVPKFHIGKGELFHYVFVKDYGKDEKKRKINVMILTDEIKDLAEHIDWDEMTRRNILMKTSAVFILLNWVSAAVSVALPKKKKGVKDEEAIPSCSS